jgi:hypothetical protein
LPESQWRGKFKINMHARSSVDQIWKKIIRNEEEHFKKLGLQSKVQAILDIDFCALGTYATAGLAEEIGMVLIVEFFGNV